MAIELNRLLQALPEDDRAAVESAGRQVHLDAGETLYSPGVRIDYIYFPRNCVISIMAVVADGNGAGVALIGREGAVGLTGSLPLQTTPFQFQTLLGGTAFRVPAERIVAVLEKHDELRLSLAAYQERFLLQVSRLAVCNAMHGLEQRLARWLLEISSRAPDPRIVVTQELLARIMGVHRSTMIRGIQRLQEVGSVAQSRRGAIEIADFNLLRKRACECETSHS